MKTYLHQKLHARMIKVALLMIAKARNNPNVHQQLEWTKKLWYIHITKYYTGKLLLYESYSHNSLECQTQEHILWFLLYKVLKEPKWIYGDNVSIVGGHRESCWVMFYILSWMLVT